MNTGRYPIIESIVAVRVSEVSSRWTLLQTAADERASPNQNEGGQGPAQPEMGRRPISIMESPVRISPVSRSEDRARGCVGHITRYIMARAAQVRTIKETGDPGRNFRRAGPLRREGFVRQRVLARSSGSDIRPGAGVRGHLPSHTRYRLELHKYRRS